MEENQSIPSIDHTPTSDTLRFWIVDQSGKPF